MNLARIKSVNTAFSNKCVNLVPQKVIKYKGASSLVVPSAVLAGLGLTYISVQNSISTQQTNQKLIHNLHKKLEKQMQVVTEKDIITCVDNISKKYNVPETEVLKIISRITQFGSFSQLQSLGDKLTEQDIGGFYLDSGISLNRTLYYLAHKKQQFQIEGKNTAFILDDKGIEYLKKLDSHQLDKFKNEVRNGKIKLINLDGTGLQIDGETASYTLFDGKQDLGKLTDFIFEQLKSGKNIEDVLNGHYKQSVNTILGQEFGDKIINISTTSTPEVSSIVKQIQPNMPSENAIQILAKKLKYTKTPEDMIEEIIDILQNSASYSVPLLLKPIFDIKNPDSTFLTCMQAGACNDISKKLVEIGVPRECAILLNNSMFKDKKISDDNIEEEIKIILRDNYQTLPYWTQVQLQFLI